MKQRAVAGLTPEEQAQVLDIQEQIIDLFVHRGAALAAGDQTHAAVLQAEIETLLREREDIRRWAVAEQC